MNLIALGPLGLVALLSCVSTRTIVEGTTASIRRTAKRSYMDRQGVAVCIAGGDSNTLSLPIVHQSIKENLLDALNADVFAVVGGSLEESNRDQHRQVQHVFTDVFHAVDAVYHNTSNHKTDCLLNDDNQSLFAGTLREHKFMAECFGLVKNEEKKRGKLYKWILKTRTDMVWIKSIDPSLIAWKPDDKVYTADQTDAIFLAPRRFANVAFGMYKALCQGPQPEIEIHHPLYQTTGFPNFLKSSYIRQQQVDFPAITRRHSQEDSQARFFCETYKGPRVFGRSAEDCMAWLYRTFEWGDLHKSHQFVYPLVHESDGKSRAPVSGTSRIIHQTSKSKEDVLLLPLFKNYCNNSFKRPNGPISGWLFIYKKPTTNILANKSLVDSLYL